MVEPRALDDFKGGDWIGIHYLKKDNGEPLYDFPTIAKCVPNSNHKCIDDCVEVQMAPPGCPLQLKREDISRIWKIGEVHT